MMGSRAAAILLALPLAGVSAVAALPGLFVGFVLTCDESCGSARGPWGDASAWQWQALGLAGLGGGALGLGFLVVVGLRRTGLALATLVLWVGCAVVFLTLMADAGFESHATEGWYAVAILTLLGVVALALCRPGPARGEARP